jgi:hypothetical protein
MSWVALRHWLTHLPREARVLVLGLGAVLALILTFMLSNLWASATRSWSEISRSEPRIARLKGYQASRPAMRQAMSEASVILKQMSFDSGDDESQTGARLQQALRGFAETAGLTVRGSQLMSVVNQSESPDGFLILTVELRMRGLPSALDEFLGDVYAHNPLLKVAELNMVKVRDRRTSRRRNQSQSTIAQDLDINIQVSALMVSA